MENEVFCEIMRSAGKGLILTYESGAEIRIRRCGDRWRISCAALVAYGHFDDKSIDGMATFSEDSGRPSVSFDIKHINGVWWEPLQE